MAARQGRRHRDRRQFITGIYYLILVSRNSATKVKEVKETVQTVGFNKPPGPAFGRPDDKLRAMRQRQESRRGNCALRSILSATIEIVRTDLEMAILC